jgi:hypothetical protein
MYQIGKFMRVHCLRILGIVTFPIGTHKMEGSGGFDCHVDRVRGKRGKHNFTTTMKVSASARARSPD